MRSTIAYNIELERQRKLAAARAAKANESASKTEPHDESKIDHNTGSIDGKDATSEECQNDRPVELDNYEVEKSTKTDRTGMVAEQ